MPDQKAQHNLAIERKLGDKLRQRLPLGAAEFIMFFLKMGWAALFGILLLAAMLSTAAYWPDTWIVARYDALLAYALVIQIALLKFGFETREEAYVILLFHLTGTVMEVYKLHMGSWDYPGNGLFEIGGVPLFSGFMYASVGSFIARAIRLFDMRMTPYPRLWITFVFASAIYLNFFTHHFILDIRNLLFLASIALFIRTRIWFKIGGWYWMPLPVAALLSSFFLWLAENIGTATRIWLYTGQHAGEMVHFSKMGSWYLLLYVSFITVTIVQRDALAPKAKAPREITPNRATS